MLIGPLPQWRSRRRSSGEPSRLRWRRTLTSGRDWRDDEATTLARSTIVVDSYLWKVYPAGRITVYGKDEFGLLFELGTGPEQPLSTEGPCRITRGTASPGHTARPGWGEGAPQASWVVNLRARP